MKPPLALKAGNDLIPFHNVKRVDIEGIEIERVIIHTKDDREYEASGFDAIEAVMAMKPSAMEGRRLRWAKHAWAFHNLVGHPMVQLLAWMGFNRTAIRFHDYTTPTPRGRR